MIFLLIVENLQILFYLYVNLFSYIKNSMIRDNNTTILHHLFGNYEYYLIINNNNETNYIIYGQ